MYDVPDEPTLDHLTHEPACNRCGHGLHVFLPCGDECDCPAILMPGA